MENSSDSDKSYYHILQKAGVLKNFSVAKVVSRKEIEDLKQLIKAVAKDKEEYEKLLQEELAQIGNMHDPKTPIPGIIYIQEKSVLIKGIQKTAKEYAEKLKAGKLTKRNLCILIASIIKELGLTQEDFLRLNEDDDSEDSSGDGI